MVTNLEQKNRESTSTAVHVTAEVFLSVTRYEELIEEKSDSFHVSVLAFISEGNRGSKQKGYFSFFPQEDGCVSSMVPLRVYLLPGCNHADWKFYFSSFC